MTSPRYSIITVCKGRLEHLRVTLPVMLAQADAEVIVVDYGCPDGTGDMVERDFPAARLVRVGERPGFSNWAGRNAGAAVARGQFLLFCDADVVLQPDATKRLATIVMPGMFGMVRNDSSRSSVENDDRLSYNQLKGFQVIPRAAFNMVSGYDELFTGYAAGGDTDIEVKLQFAGLKPVPLSTDLVASVIHHDSAARVRFHDDSIGQSYLTGLMYRQAKHAMLKQSGKRELTEAARRRLYETARRQAKAFADKGETMMMVKYLDMPIGMPRQIGFEDATLRVSIKIDVVGGTPLGGK